MGVMLYLLRHGETTFSRTGGFCGQIDPELTPEGHQMAEAFAVAYRSVPWQAIYCSPMLRTVATATPLSQALAMPLQLRDGLKEISYGEWEGRTVAEVLQSHPEDHERWQTEPSWYPPTGGESGAQVAERASSVITEILAQHADGNMLVVSHKATLRLLLCIFLGIDLGRYRDRIALPAGSVTGIRFGKHGPMLEFLGDRSYMSKELRSMPGT